MSRLNGALLWLVIVGVVLDLAISVLLGVLAIDQAHNTHHLNQITHTAQCWDRVLEHAVKRDVPRPVLLNQAGNCATLLP